MRPITTNGLIGSSRIKMRILMTGAGGFVGQAIFEELKNDNFEILRIEGKNRKGRRKENCFEIDISDKTQVKTLETIGNLDVVIHCAGLAHQFGQTEYAKFEKVNVEGTENIVRLAVNLNVRHFIQISSVSVYGNNFENRDKILDEDQSCNPVEAYGLSKFEGEKAARAMCEENKVDLTILRLATVVGEGDGGNVLKLIEAIARKRFLWIGKGKNLKSLVYKNDVGTVCKLLIEKKRKGTEIFNISANPESMKEIVSEIETSLNVSVPKLKIPSELIGNLLKLNHLLKLKKIGNFSKSINRWLANDAYAADKIFKEYNFKTSLSALEALKKEVIWYKQKNK